MTEEKQPLYKKKWFVTLAIFSIFLVANVIYSAALGHGGIPNFSVIEDADKTDRGTYMLCDTTFRSMSDRSGVGPYRNRVIEVNKEGEVIWETTGFAGLHEIEYLPNGHLLIADTQNNRVVEINYPDKTEGWDWNPNKINWTEVNPKWGADHYYNNEKSFDWSHLNDVDFKSYPTWDACLISMRNFDLIVEVNFTAEMENPYQAENIVWYYGDHEDYSLMNHQHNPDYLPNGNIIVVDSQNQRVIEINKTTKEQVWEYDKIRGWCRDADLLPNGNVLIAESFSVYTINKTTKEKVWEYEEELLASYDADLLDNGNILIGTSQGGMVYEVDPETNERVWEYGNTEIKGIVYMNCIMAIAFVLFGFLYLYKKEGKIDLKTHNIVYPIGILLIILATITMTNFWWITNHVIIFMSITLSFA